ncbi:hypothetical protein Rsub_04019 [Raphidocelis subcapitata]|uniref:Uncharacterized protein n=1 Tax=Raphidocelis subcapitata TaxID=307507 RepID=A0A2V0P3Q4_9CHLO|nr:hypothetical protein Rsub_04019 [Raphidocelis subcapitata]|eukprot:GBF91715.1 hypothetical protein Rsub_04019 [Raphidocelis subcapitata]
MALDDECASAPPPAPLAPALADLLAGRGALSVSGAGPTPPTHLHAPLRAERGGAPPGHAGGTDSSGGDSSPEARPHKRRAVAQYTNGAPRARRASASDAEAAADGGAAAGPPRRARALRPLRLDFDSLDPQVAALTPGNAAAAAATAAAAAAAAGQGGGQGGAPTTGAAGAPRSCSASPSEWMDTLERRLGTRGGRAGGGRGGSSGGGGPPRAAAAGAGGGGEGAAGDGEDEIVPPAFVCLGIMRSSCP